MSFIPNDYHLPKTGNGNYTKLQQGTTKIRILSSPIMGWVHWVEENGNKKPVRNLNRTNEDARHFWALKIWNYNSEKIELWDVTQYSIQEALYNLSQGSWGDPKGYDIEISKTGQDKNTKYMVTPLRPERLKNEILDIDSQTEVRLESLLEGGDPFAEGTPF